MHGQVIGRNSIGGWQHRLHNRGGYRLSTVTFGIRVESISRVGEGAVDMGGNGTAAQTPSSGEFGKFPMSRLPLSKIGSVSW